MTTKTKIKKWGNSLAIRLPKTSVDLLNLKENSLVSFDYDKKQIVIKPEKKKNVFTLKGLTDKITKDNLHEEIDWGKPVGKEVW